MATTPNPKGTQPMFTVWQHDPYDLEADPDYPTPEHSVFLAQFDTETEAVSFSARAHELLAAEAVDPELIRVLVATWPTPAPFSRHTIAPWLFALMTCRVLNETSGADWEEIRTGGGCHALAPSYAYLDGRRVDLLVTDSENAQSPDSTTEQITVTAYSTLTGNEIRTVYMGNVTATPEGIAEAVRVTLAEMSVAA
jgi:hypothetical protein